MYIGIPQAIMLVLIMLGLGINMAKNGQPKDEKYSFGASLLNSIINLVILYYGGFFN